ncbi:MAG TPA: hypothetical protein VFD26_06675, partial [Methyloceanibacter sp.]|nr:hypothetical protein [Methyloceanibacter sp.]
MNCRGRIADGDHRLGSGVLETELERGVGARELNFLAGRQEIVLLELVRKDHRALTLAIDIDQREVAVLLRFDGEHRKVVHFVIGAVGGESEVEIVGLLLALAADRCHLGSGRDLDRLVVGNFLDQVLEHRLEDFAGQHALLEPALELHRLAAGVGQAFREGFGRQAILGRGDLEVDRLLI